MKAALRVSTSDVGTSGANLYPMLLCGPKQNTIALGDPLRLSHENGATLEQFDKQLGLLFGKYQAALKNLTRPVSYTHLDVDKRQVFHLGSTFARMKLKGIDRDPHKRWSMWFNSKQREEPYQVLTSH